MPEIDRLWYTIGVNTSELETGVSRAEQQFNKLVGTVANLAATIGIAFGFQGIIRDIQNLTMSFDSAMRQVWTLTDMTTEEFNKLQESVIELSKEGPYSAEELARALYQTISAGVDAGNAIDFLSQAMLAAQAGATDLFTAVDGLTTIMNAWGLSMEELSRVSDSIFVAVREGKTTFTELAMTIGTVAPTASQAGISLEEVLSAVAALTKQGIDTARAMTSLNYAIQSVIAPTEEAKKTARGLGIEFNSSALASKGLVHFLRDIYTAAQGNQETLSKLFGSVEALRGVFALTGNAADDFSEILNEMANSAGETEKAADKMANSLETQFKKLQNRLNSVKMKIGLAFKPVIDIVIELGEKFAKWVENMSPAEKAILEISTALIALIPIIKTLAFAWGLLNAMTGNWVAAIAGAGAVVATLTIAFGTMRQEIGETVEQGQDLTDTFESMSEVSVTDLVTKLDQASRNIEDAKTGAEQLKEAMDELVQLAIDYNYAQETGLGKAKEIKKQIDELIETYPALNSAVELTGDKYQIHIDKLKTILELELQRIDSAIEQAKIELEALRANKEVLQPLEGTYRERLEEAKQAAKELTRLIKEQEEFLENAPEHLRPAAEGLLQMYKQGLVTAQQEISEYSEKLSEVLELNQKELALEREIASLQNARANLAKRINNLPSEGEPPSTYEQELQQLDKLIEDQKKKLDEYTKKSGEAYEADLEILRLYIAKKLNFLRESVQYMTEQMEAPEKIKPVVEQIQQLEKDLENYKVVESAEIIDFSEIEKSFVALDKLIEQHNEEASEQLYRNLRSQIVSALTRAYIEGDEEAITKLEQHFTKIKSYADIFEPKDFSEIERSIQVLQERIDQGDKEVAKLIYGSLKSQILSAIVRAYIEGNQEAMEKLEQYRTQLQPFEKLLTPEEKNPLEESYDETLKLIDALNKAIAEGNMKLAEEIYQDLMRGISSGLKEALISGNDEFIQLFENLQTRVKEHFGELFAETIDVDQIKDQIELLKQALYEGREDVAQRIFSELNKTLEQNIQQAYLEDNAELLTELEKQKNRLDTIMQRHERFKKVLEEEGETITRVAKATSSLDDSRDRGMKRWHDFMLNLQKEQLEGQLYGEQDIQKRIGILEQLIDINKELGLSAAEYEKQIERLNERLKKQNELDEENLRKNEAYRKTMQELALSTAERATSWRYENWNEMVQIQQLREIADDVNKSYEERIEALQKILNLQKTIGANESLIRETEEKIKSLQGEQEKLAKSKARELEKQNKLLETQANFLNKLKNEISTTLKQFGDIGELVATVVDSIEFEVKEITENGEVVGYELVNPFENINELTKEIASNLALWGIQEIAKTVSLVVQDLQAAFTYVDKMSEKTMTSTAELLKNFREFNENLTQKQALEGMQAGLRTGLTGLGGLVGFLFGPLGALIGAGIGSMIGNAVAGSLDEEIAKLNEKLQATWQKVKEALGTDIDSVASALEKAFSATTYEDFVSNFSQSLEAMTKQALIKAFLASEYMQPLFDVLSDTISSAVLDGVLTAEEIAAIQQAGQDVIGAATPFFEALKALFGEGTEWTAGSAVTHANITEETASRLAALLSTINLNVTQIKDKVVDGIVKVEVTNAQSGIAPIEYWRASGG